MRRISKRNNYINIFKNSSGNGKSFRFFDDACRVIEEGRNYETAKELLEKSEKVIELLQVARKGKENYAEIEIDIENSCNEIYFSPSDETGTVYIMLGNSRILEKIPCHITITESKQKLEILIQIFSKLKNELQKLIEYWEEEEEDGK